MPETGVRRTLPPVLDQSAGSHPADSHAPSPLLAGFKCQPDLRGQNNG
jgi:hypothetical protein